MLAHEGKPAESSLGSSPYDAIGSSGVKSKSRTRVLLSYVANILLLSCLALNVLYMNLHAPNNHQQGSVEAQASFASSAQPSSAQPSSAKPNGEKLDLVSPEESCELKERLNQQLCGVGMMKTVWKPATKKNSKVSPKLIADPSCPRSKEVFDMANDHRKSGTKRKMTFAILYYEEPLFLSLQIASWMKWYKSRGEFNFLVIDDGSRPGLKAADVLNDPELLREIIASKINLEVYEIEQNLCWNIAGARNLAVFMTKTDYLYLGDVDALVEDGTAQYMLKLKEKEEDEFQSNGQRTLYKHFDRMRKDGITRERHPAVMVISKHTFWTAGGLDEDGFFSSTKFRDRAKLSGIQIKSVNSDMVKKGVPPMQELGNKMPCPTINSSNCNEMLKLKQEREKYASSRLQKPKAKKFWAQKFRGKIPWSNDYLRFSWKRAYVNEASLS
ncbi:hypothetical protein ACHAWF_005265 [Thalassiosira exigua]